MRLYLTIHQVLLVVVEASAHGEGVEGVEEETEVGEEAASADEVSITHSISP